MTKSATVFNSADVTVSDRPISTFDIAGVDYEIRCPKLRVWLEIVLQQENYDAGQALKPKVIDLTFKLAGNQSPAEREDLIAQFTALQPVYSAAPNPLQFAQSILDFLCSCMVEDGAGDRLRSLYWANDGVMDLPHLREALREMEDRFEEWLDEQAAVTGVVRQATAEPDPEPAPTNRASRRSGTKTPRPRATVRRKA